MDRQRFYDKVREIIGRSDEKDAQILSDLLAMTMNYYGRLKNLEVVNERLHKRIDQLSKANIEKAQAFCKKWLDDIIRIYLPELKDEPFYSQAQEYVRTKLKQAMEE